MTYAEVIHVEEAKKDNCNCDNLWVITNTLLSDSMEDHENETKECIDEDVHDVTVNAKAVLHSFDVGPRGFYDVVFHSPEHRSALLPKVLVFFTHIY